MKRKILVGVFALSLMLLGGVVTTKAGTSFVDYNLNVGAFNGSAHTSSQTKTSSGTDGYLNSYSVGGKYLVDVRMNYVTRTGNASGAWVRRVDDNRSYTIPNGAGSGVSASLEFSNDLTTPVRVNVNGKWASN